MITATVWVWFDLCVMFVFLSFGDFMDGQKAYRRMISWEELARAIDKIKARSDTRRIAHGLPA